MYTTLITTGIGAGCFAAGFIGGKFFDNGLANALCVETLQHGTNLFSYGRIRLCGGDPRAGGAHSGSTYGQREDYVYNDTPNRFYVFKDSEYHHFHPPKEVKSSIGKTLYIFYKWIGADYHSFLSGYNCINKVCGLSPESDSLLVKCARVFCGTIGGLITLILTPTLKFRVSKIDHKRFIDDDKYAEMAYWTASKLEPWRIGILGSVLTGVNLDLFSRVKARPQQFILGILQMAAAAAIFYATFYYTLRAQIPLTIIIAPCAAGFLLA